MSGIQSCGCPQPYNNARREPLAGSSPKSGEGSFGCLGTIPELMEPQIDRPLLRMALTFIYKCPNTGFNVQGFVADKPAPGATLFIL